MPSLKKYKLSQPVKSILFSSMLMTPAVLPMAHADTQTDNLQQRISEQAKEISRLNKQINKMNSQYQESINSLTERLNNIENNNNNISSSSTINLAPPEETKIVNKEEKLKAIMHAKEEFKSQENSVVTKTSTKKIENKIVDEAIIARPFVPQPEESTTTANTTKVEPVNIPKTITVKTEPTAPESKIIAVSSKPYVEDISTPESERISVSPEVLFAQKFGTKFEPSDDPSETYLKALQAFSANDIETAIHEFKRYIHFHSDHTLIAKAHYWLGMSHIKEEPANYSAARFEFMEVINRFSYHPNNDKKPKALFRLAQLSKINNYEAEVRKYVDMLNKDYPNSPEAQQAKEVFK